MTGRGTIGTLLAVFLIISGNALSQERPCLVITGADVRAMREARGKYPLFDRSLSEARAVVEAALAKPIDVPRPADAGGITHEQHKLNYTVMMLAGVLYQVSGERRYAGFVRRMLLAYADLYPSLGTHPMALSEESSGRLFWQTLNETVWLVHAAQAYDCVYERLTVDDRKAIEAKLFRPMARFLTEDRARDIDRIHNHGTWMVAAVGMLGYALRDGELTGIALRGTRKDGAAGFLRQLDLLFSPDGYYTEGPYYQRYALQPFLLFAQAIDNNDPGLRIFKYRGGILGKAVSAAVQLTSPTGTFIPLNDALKEMSLSAKEMVTALDIAYARCGMDRSLLPFVMMQDRVTLSGAGLAVARDLLRSPVPNEPVLRSAEFRDGADGSSGAVGILRSGRRGDGPTVLLKYASQGMGHGHFDRLGVLYYDQGREILQDYGAARWINIESKFGGRYLPENNSWAKQTIAHNCLTVDGASQFNANLSEAESHPASRHFFNGDRSGVQVMSGKASGTYPGVEMQRTVALLTDTLFTYPVILDLLRVTSTVTHQYDLPFFYMGQLMETTVKLQVHAAAREALGTENGYQHLWNEAEGSATGPIRWTWLNGNRFYSVISSADTGTQLLCTRIGAGDPRFNLRSEPAIILRRRAASTTFASLIAPHGYFDPVEEVSRGARPIVESVQVIVSSDEGTVALIRGGGAEWVFMVTNRESSPIASHEISVGGTVYRWVGDYRLERR
jgi:hypothetical protein